jgi:hypothetical protein
VRRTRKIVNAARQGEFCGRGDRFDPIHVKTANHAMRFMRIMGACLLLLVLVASLCSSTHALELLVPAYGHPCCGAGQEMWTRMTEWTRGNGPHLNVILNPNSGPGAAQIDAAYVGSAGQAGPLLELRRAGATVVGYVHTQYGQRPWELVKAEIDRYFDESYWRGAGIQVDGVFVDEMSNDLARVPYYQQLHDHVRTKALATKIIGNPGLRATINSGGAATRWTNEDYLRTVDTLVVFEDSGAAYRAATRWPEWIQVANSQHFAHIVHSELTAESMETVISLARQRNAGMLYVTDDGMPNPYDRLPTYWEAEVRALTVPEPSAGGLGWSGLSWLVWRRRMTARRGIRIAAAGYTIA